MTQIHLPAGAATPAAAQQPPGTPAARSAARTESDEAPRVRTGRLPSLTGLRAMFALLVFVRHVALPLPTTRLLADDHAAAELFRYTKNISGPVIGFFFLLSGFVLTWTARPGDTARGFWRRRAVRAFPVYIVTWALALTVWAAAVTPAGPAVANLLMVQGFVPKFTWFSSVDYPSWSMSCEVLFYAFFPVLYRLLERIRPQDLKYWIAGFIALDVATPALAYALFSSTPYTAGADQVGAYVSDLQYWFAFYSPPMRMSDFLLGMLAALAIRHGRWWNIGFTWSTLGIIGSCVLCYRVPYLYGQRGLFVILPMLFLLAAAAEADLEGRFSPLRGPAMMWLGETSYAFYLLHFVILVYARKVLGQAYFTPTATAFLLAALLALSVFLSRALFVLVERPLVERFSRPRRRRAPA